MTSIEWSIFRKSGNRFSGSKMRQRKKLEQGRTRMIDLTQQPAALQIPDRVRRRALSLGAAGVAWLEGLDDLLRDIATEWRLSIEQILPGGTESLVVNVTTEEGQDAVLKVAIPGLDPTARQLRTLIAARGRGYVGVIRHDRARDAMLLERLGCQLAELGLPLDTQIEAICATLLQAWTPLPEGERFMTGAEKAQSHADFIARAWRELGEPCAAQIVEMACRFADIRCRAFDPESAVLAHGDPHACNTLLVPGEPQRFKLVDHDGLFVERAYDLSILMREWGAEFLAGDPLVLGRRRCHLLARLTGVAPDPIWQWGFIERTANGLLLLQLGLESLARESLAIVDAWAAGDQPIRSNST
jgi:streptomycin 6-kinase